MLLKVATQNNMIVYQMDVETAFLNGTLDEKFLQSNCLATLKREMSILHVN
jgi:hypothetical protein